MGIYILKEFPKNCNDCPCTSGWNCFADDEMRDIAEYDDNHTKPDWCPLVEVPTPHGRLIDADAIPYIFGSTHATEYDTVTKFVINKLPTIIEGDGKE